MNLIKRFWNFLNKPDPSDQERIDKLHKEVDEADRVKELHRKARKQSKNTAPPDMAERSIRKAKDIIKKNKNKTLSSNF